MGLVAILEAGRRDFLDATGAISSEQACAKPSAAGWSVLECIEHTAAAEERYLGWIARGTPVSPQRNPEKEMRLFSIIRSRLTKVEAPAALRPRGRFATLDDALAEFNAVRDRTIQLVQERGAGLYAIATRHPYFGKLNGAEWVQLIDAHARRHAGQIRENREALRIPTDVSMKLPRASKPFAFKRDEPDLPAAFECPSEPGRVLTDGDMAAVEGVRLEDVDRRNLAVNTLRIEGCVLDRVQLAGAQLGAGVWKDVRLVGCDLSNVRAHRLALTRVEFIDCRLTGFIATALAWQDVLIQNGDLRYAQFQGGKFRACEFKDCNWQESDLQNADLSGSVFRSCNLALADLKGATLLNADLRASEVEGMVVGMHDLRGAIVEPAQAMVLARVLGMQICGLR